MPDANDGPMKIRRDDMGWLIEGLGLRYGAFTEGEAKHALRQFNEVAQAAYAAGHAAGVAELAAKMKYDDVRRMWIASDLTIDSDRRLASALAAHKKGEGK